MTPHKSAGLTLAVRPAARGFGWVLFEGAMVPVDWGVASANKRDRSAQSMKRFQKLLEQYQPSTVVIEKGDEVRPKRSERIELLAETMRRFAENRDMDTPMYSRSEVAATITGNPEATRREVGFAVAERLPILRLHMPRARKMWEREQGRQWLFDAAALGVTHYDLTHPD